MMAGKINEKKQREDSAAGKRIDVLLGLAKEKYDAGEDGLSKRYVDIARKLAMRHRIRLGSKLFCKGCNTIVAKGTFVVRVVGKKPYRICKACGRKSLLGKTLPASGNAQKA